MELALVQVAHCNEDIYNFGLADTVMGTICSQLQRNNNIVSPWHLDHWRVEDMEVDNMFSFRAKIVLGNYEDEAEECG